MDLFQEMPVWARISDTLAIKYCGLRHLETGRYAIQSADYFYLPVDEQQLRHSAKQFVELFIETSPVERCDWFDSLPAAIHAFNQLFEIDVDDATHVDSDMINLDLKH